MLNIVLRLYWLIASVIKKPRYQHQYFYRRQEYYLSWLPDPVEHIPCLKQASLYIERKSSRQYRLDKAESLVYIFMKAAEQVDIGEGGPALTNTMVWLF